MRGCLIAALIALALFVTSSGAHAQAVYTHAVQEGDTLASIAQRYYGDPTREAVLREANRMRGAAENELIQGSWLFIPMVSFHRVEKTETWRSIRETARPLSCGNIMSARISR